MAAKIALALLFAFVLIQFATCASVRVVRDAGEDAGKAIDEAVEGLKGTFDELLQNIQNNDIVKDLTDSVNKIGASIQSQGKDLVAKIQEAGTKN